MRVGEVFWQSPTWTCKPWHISSVEIYKRHMLVWQHMEFGLAFGSIWSLVLLHADVER